MWGVGGLSAHDARRQLNARPQSDKFRLRLLPLPTSSHQARVAFSGAQRQQQQQQVKQSQQRYRKFPLSISRVFPQNRSKTLENSTKFPGISGREGGGEGSISIKCNPVRQWALLKEGAWLSIAIDTQRMRYASLINSKDRKIVHKLSKARANCACN